MYCFSLLKSGFYAFDKLPRMIFASQIFKRESLVVIIWVVCGWLLCSTAMASPGTNFSKWAISASATVFPTMMSTEATDDVTDWSSSPDRKIIVQARDDAIMFFASAGEYRGVFLDSALEVLKAYGLQRSDMDLAQWIVTETSIDN